MRVAILARSLRASGGLHVGRNLIAALAATAPETPLLIAVPEVSAYQDIVLPEGSERLVFRGTGNPLAEAHFDTFAFPARLRAFRPDLLFCLGNVGIPTPPCPQAILFHKAQLVYPREHYPGESRRAHLKNALIRRRLIRSLRRTGLVFCQTETVRRRFARTYGFPIDRISLLPNAPEPFEETGPAPLPEVVADPERFHLLYLAHYYGHKNYDIILEAFRRHRARLAGVRCITTITADQHPRAGRFLEAIGREGLGDLLVNVGPLDRAGIAAYMQHCDALVFPSLLESFSGTYLEAMGFGLPILTSDLDFAHDVCGEAADFFDPRDPDSLADAILALRGNPGRQRELAERGRRRLEGFFGDWRTIAAEAWRVLRPLAAGRSAGPWANLPVPET